MAATATPPPKISPRGGARSYDAFLSYGHAADGRLAPALQAGLQSLAKPWYRRRALRVFRDNTSLSASPEPWPAIEGALSQSDYFVLLASPGAAASRWVEQEVRWWRAHRSHDTVLIALTDGRLAGSDFTRSDGSVEKARAIAIVAGYEATITPATGSPFQDHGVASTSVEEILLGGQRVGGIFQEEFHSRVEPPPLPRTKDECKKGGWKSFGIFKNEGDCVAWVQKPRAGTSRDSPSRPISTLLGSALVGQRKNSLIRGPAPGSLVSRGRRSGWGPLGDAD